MKCLCNAQEWTEVEMMKQLRKVVHIQTKMPVFLSDAREGQGCQGVDREWGLIVRMSDGHTAPTARDTTRTG